MLFVTKKIVTKKILSQKSFCHKKNFNKIFCQKEVAKKIVYTNILPLLANRMSYLYL